MVTTKTQRLFFAIELTPTLRRAILRATRHFATQKYGRPIQWTPEEKLHITLRFLGSVNEEKIPDCLDAAAQNLRDISPFEITLGTLVVLPKRHPRVIALSVPLSVEIASLYYQLEIAMTRLEFSPENRPFFPHITLGQTKSLLTPAACSALLAEDLTHLHHNKQRVRSITLFRSDSSAAGSIYTSLGRLCL